MNPTVSVNLCCYNSEKYLEETLQSVFAQTFKDWELVIVNDGSTDATDAIIRKHIAAGRPIVYHLQPNAGLAPSRNQALRLSRGKYIAFLDHDDILLPDALENQVRHIEEGKAALSYGGYIVINTKGVEKKRLLPRHRSGFLLGKLLRRYEMFAPSGVLVDRQALLDLKLEFDPNLTMTEDYCLFLLVAAERRIAVSPCIISKVRVHVDSLTTRSMGRWASEFDYTHNLIQQRHPGIQAEYAADFRQANARSHYAHALWMAKQGRRDDATRELRKIIFVSPKYLALFLVLLASPTLWNKLESKLSSNRDLD
ncbi:MAG: glycosyltransferase family 2 protein [Opitutaceae bacterium]|nr:glycosyltransferase family 2 protein [Opitutaceae bacterium]